MEKIGPFVYLVPSDCSRCVTENPGVASRPLGLGHRTATFPASPLLASPPSGHMGRRDGEEKSRQSIGKRQVVAEAIVKRKDDNTREEMKGLTSFCSQQET